MCIAEAEMVNSITKVGMMEQQKYLLKYCLMSC